MSANTRIEWADHTFNPWIGCTRVSEGCRNCYAERMAGRFGQTWGPAGERRRTAESTWKQPLAWNRQAQREGRRYSVFPSMCDPFDDHPSITDAMASDFGKLICDTPNLDWLLLTKRPESIEERLPVMFPPHSGHLPASLNVRIGVSVEDQTTANERIQELLRQWSGPNFVSYEPALGPVDFTVTWYGETALDPGGIDWLIAGGESGPGARPAHPDWFRSVRDQCQAAGVAFFMKQWGEWAPLDHIEERVIRCRGDLVISRAGAGRRGHPLANPPESVFCFRIGKKAAGRLLDGREWSEFPR